MSPDKRGLGFRRFRQDWNVAREERVGISLGEERVRMSQGKRRIECHKGRRGWNDARDKRFGSLGKLRREAWNVEGEERVGISLGELRVRMSPGKKGLKCNCGKKELECRRGREA